MPSVPPKNNITKNAEDILISGIRKGDKSAFGELYDLYAPSLLGIISKMLGNCKRAEEILQQAFLELYGNIHNYDASKGSIFYWMLQMVREKCLEIINAPGAINNFDHPGEGLSNLNIKIMKDRAFELVYFRGYSLAEAADKLNISEEELRMKIREKIKNISINDNGQG